MIESKLKAKIHGCNSWSNLDNNLKGKTNESLEAIKKLKMEELKNILCDRGQPVTGKNADLVLRGNVLSTLLQVMLLQKMLKEILCCG